MFVGKGYSKYPPWSKKRKQEMSKMKIETSVRTPGDKSMVEKTLDSIKQLFKK
tara:strand:- start:476 stop:634 length:159 start_codon:yes stop_codon:yes gene_type:complete